MVSFILYFKIILLSTDWSLWCIPNIQILQKMHMTHGTNNWTQLLSEIWNTQTIEWYSWGRSENFQFFITYYMYSSFNSHFYFQQLFASWYYKPFHITLDVKSAQQSKNTVSALKTTFRVLSFVLENSQSD